MCINKGTDPDPVRQTLLRETERFVSTIFYVGDLLVSFLVLMATRDTSNTFLQWWKKSFRDESGVSNQLHQPPVTFLPYVR